MAEEPVESAANWSGRVEELVDGGDVDGAMSVLESVVAVLENQASPSPNLRLAYALTDLASLYRGRGFSIKADELESRALLVRLRSSSSGPRLPPADSSSCSRAGERCDLEETGVPEGKTVASADDDDWEAVVDRELNDATTSKEAEELSNLSLEELKIQVPKRRGRGAFLYERNGLHCDQILDGAAPDNCEDEDKHQQSNRSIAMTDSLYGTSHVLVLSGFPPTTRTTELEKILSSYVDRGVAIRWVNDTTALAVFKSASVAHEAQSSITFPFHVHILDENDDILSSLSKKDLEPPYPRPKTSARTAQRLIAQGMGRKLPTGFGANELKKQENERRNRIHQRQTLRDEAWGPDDP